MKTVRVYLTVKSDAVTVNDIKCKTYEDVVAAFAKVAEKVGYKAIDDVPADCWLWQNSSKMDYPEDYTQDNDILNLVGLLMNGDKDPRNAIWR